MVPSTGRRLLGIVLVLGLLPSVRVGAETDAPQSYDVIVYGGTSGGVAAAVQVRRMGRSVLLIEPGQHLGGLTSGGLGATDIGNKAAIGGIAREFYQRIKQHYAHPGSWVHEQPEQYRDPRQAAMDDAMWTFEPSVAEHLFADFVREAGVRVVLGQRLDLRSGVVKENGRIVEVRMEDGPSYRGRYFIDATYEGDLMALAGVAFHVGREANATYDETLNGVQTRHAIHHQMMPNVDPYVRPGDPSSGLLPGVHPGPPGEEGAGDRRVQAYNFRMCLTDVPANQLPFDEPEGYDPLRYELLLRNFEAGETRTPWSLLLMPNRKTDINNNYGFSTDNIGMNDGWAEGDYATRERIFAEHLLYQQGLLWTLAHDPRVPPDVRQEVSAWGLCKDEFTATSGWPHQLYVREARRMISEYVMTQHHCQGRLTAEDPVGLAAYTMDSHNVQRYVTAEGFARNEGDVQVGGFSPYPISYRAIRPRKDECQNLLVPVCLSASHIAYGSIRMEPVFMVLGQSAATAACLALDQNVAVQDVDAAALRERLLADKQVLVWTDPRVAAGISIDVAQLPGIVVDDVALQLSPHWTPSTSSPSYVGARYWHDGNTGKGEKQALFRVALPEAGRYEVRVAYAPHGNRATNVPVTVVHAEGETVIKVNQREQPQIDRAFVTLGTFEFSRKEAVVIVSNTGTDGYVIVDAVQLIRER